MYCEWTKRKWWKLVQFVLGSFKLRSYGHAHAPWVNVSTMVPDIGVKDNCRNRWRRHGTMDVCTRIVYCAGLSASKCLHHSRLYIVLKAQLEDFWVARKCHAQSHGTTLADRIRDSCRGSKSDISTPIQGYSVSEDYKTSNFGPLHLSLIRSARVVSGEIVHSVKLLEVGRG